MVCISPFLLDCVSVDTRLFAHSKASGTSEAEMEGTARRNRAVSIATRMMKCIHSTLYVDPSCVRGIKRFRR